MVHTISIVANSYVALVAEMETSQNANKLLGQNFEDQIMVNGVYSIFLQSPDTKTAIKNITLLMTEHFDLSEIEFCTDEQNSGRAYKLDRTGMVLPVIVNFTCKQDIRDELDYSGIVCTDLRTIGMDRERKTLAAYSPAPTTRDPTAECCSTPPAPRTANGAAANAACSNP